MITLQYLEPGPHISIISKQAVREKLRAACDILPIKALLLGWELPDPLLKVCRDVTAMAGVKLFRWHPLLTGDGNFYPKSEWLARNWRGDPIPGFRGLPEFTFVCPNHPSAREAVLNHLSVVSCSGYYDGIFLDRMRFPSPAADLVNSLACFCDHCQCRAASQHLDLAEIGRTLSKYPVIDFLRAFFGDDVLPLSGFLEFRQQTITQLIGEAAGIVRGAGLSLGLDCFSPSLTCLVGQDVHALAPFADWTKLMIYGHALGPATLPFELGAIVQWLVDAKDLSESAALAIISDLLGFALPRDLSTLNSAGLSSAALKIEYNFGQQQSSKGQLLAGIELVEMPGVSELNSAQIEADLRALRSTGAAGLALSWDLWHMPLDRLQIVRDIWF